MVKGQHHDVSSSLHFRPHTTSPRHSGFLHSSKRCGGSPCHTAMYLLNKWGVTTACWGLGECRSDYCARTLIWTNGYHVSYKRSSRYQLKGHISEGNVSLTIENAVQSDSGPYCCIVEIPGSFRYVTYSLEIKPEISTSPPTRPTTAGGYRTTGRPITTGRPTTTDARHSYKVVEGVVGHPVTLPCTYSTNGGLTTSCWGLGECQPFYCTRTLILANGYRVLYKRRNRYQLKGYISEGNVSLTIENAVQSDSGPYCCIVEIPGSFRYVTYSLEIKPDARRSYTVVEGVVGHPVTLPCTYSTNRGIATACWGLGDCQSFYCCRTLIWTNGYSVAYKKSSRYQLKGHISGGIVSLTIQNAVQSDSGPYCCMVEIPGSYHFVTYSLEIKPSFGDRVSLCSFAPLLELSW
ncbi:uncharacterized protein LOC121831772 isoform X6 [Peromyscus maniculatus bairdii]|uniref:uncharacterized protein LOC121831772 isoform X6 n=1 Tax=Peromyscus maniculatus bairdii TaxID=230844 RepID=UPI003FD1805A